MNGLKTYLLLFTIIIITRLPAQNTGIGNLPVNIAPATSDTTRPMVLYITGDGGWNKFSKNLAQEFANRGYPVIALNSKEYFWKKKTPEQTASDVILLIKNYQKLWSRKKILLIGYSFGADVMPFIFNHLPLDIAAQVVNINLLSPSAFTDFEIHLSVMFGASVTGGESVIAAVNKINVKQLTLVFGKGENNFPLDQLKIKNYVSVILEGGHHYDGDEEKVCETIILHLPKN